MEDLRHDYLENDLVCMLQDPETLFVYLTFTPERVKTLKNFLEKVQPESKLVLRLRCASSPSLDQEIVLPSLESGRFYFHRVTPSLAHYVELGAKTPEGEFFLFTRSSELTWEPSAGETFQPAGEKAEAQGPGNLPSSWS